MGPKEKKIVAYHEVGHALVTALQKNTEPVQKITIVPRTHGALGYVMQVPEEEKFLKSKEELEEDLVTFMAGRAAEEIVFHSVTTGASNDIEQATRIARAMVAQYGMSERFGLMGLATVESQYLDGEARLNCGEETAAEIDKEVMKMLKESYEKAKQLLSENREVLDKIAAHLYEKENITGKEFMKIYRELKGIPEPEEENVAKQGSSVDFRVGEEATHTVDLNKATSSQRKKIQIKRIQGRWILNRRPMFDFEEELKNCRKSRGSISCMMQTMPSSMLEKRSNCEIVSDSISDQAIMKGSKKIIWYSRSHGLNILNGLVQLEALTQSYL